MANPIRFGRETFGFGGQCSNFVPIASEKKCYRKLSILSRVSYRVRILRQWQPNGPPRAIWSWWEPAACPSAVLGPLRGLANALAEQALDYGFVFG